MEWMLRPELYNNTQLIQNQSGNMQYIPTDRKIKVKITPPKANNGITVVDNGYLNPISQNPYSASPTYAIHGPTHEGGGVLMDINNQLIEAEGGGKLKPGELVNENSDGSVTIFSKKTKVPGTKRSFADELRGMVREEENLAKKGLKLFDKQDKAIALVNQSDPFNRYESVTYNSGLVNLDGAQQKANQLNDKLQELAQAKEGLGILQDAVNAKRYAKKAAKGVRIAGEGDKVKPAPPAEMPKQAPFPIYESDEYTKPLSGYGNDNPRDLVRSAIRLAAESEGVDPDTLERISYQESGWNPIAQGPATKYGRALGFAQFLPSTAEKYGITKEQLTSTKPEDIQAVAVAQAKHFKDLQKQYNGDNTLALIAYNGSPRAIESARKALGKQNATGNEIMGYWDLQRRANPTSKKSAWQNQTYNYVKNIAHYDADTFYARPEKGPLPLTSGGGFMSNYYRDTDPVAPLTPAKAAWETSQPVNTPQLISEYKAPDLSGTFDRAQEAVNARPVSAPDRKKSSLADHNKISLGELLPSIAAALQPVDYVPHQSFTPTLYNPYTVSLQDQLNRNTATFSDLIRRNSNNTAAQYSLAAQKYQADNQVLGEQFRINQQIQNQVNNQNVGLLNQAQQINLQLQDQQIERQAGAKARTKEQRYQAMANIANIIGQNRQENNNIRMMEAMSGFAYNPRTKQMEYMGEDHSFGGPGNSLQKITTKTDNKGTQSTTVVNDPLYQEKVRRQRLQNNWFGKAFR